ncbi:hypothetical protein [Photobacterium sanguinicancri]|uniref:hypothetical protein n=1 Tax=Photobacterium sanguinicancri TaxID=875932 RepID=UPI00247FE745|nr:hypothetical protein [Photobacterium sanguinicancri]
METVKQIVSDPIHSPCKDMAGCANFKPELTAKSAQLVRQLRKQFGFKTQALREEQRKDRLTRLAEYQARRDMYAQGGVL